MNTPILRFVVIASIAASGSRAALPAQSPPSGVVLDVEARVHEDLAVLASDQLEGRLTGTPGADSAANFIARRFYELGLQAVFRTSECSANGECRRSYFQGFRGLDYVTTNIGAIVPGTDSSLRSEFVAVTAHYDHLGRRKNRRIDYAPPNTIHPGADDDASGTAAVLELARRFSEHPLKRPVILLAFSAEELGLVGSSTFVENPPFDLHEINIVLNLDMVGRLRKDHLEIFGAQRKLKGILESANSDPRFSLAMNSSSSGRSDDFPFSLRRIPALHFTTGEHKDYHLATDTADRVNMAGLVRVIDYVERVARLVDR